MSAKGSRGRGGKRVHEEEHDNHERWLVSYADMVTLLMVLFIVMFAMSQVDQKKFLALRDGLASGFGQSVSVLDGSDAVLDEPGLQPMPPITPADLNVESIAGGSSADARGQQLEQAVAEAVAKSKQLQNQRRYAEAAAEVDRLEDVRRRLLEALEKHGLLDDVRTRIDGRGLTVSLVSEHVVFAANMPTLTQRGKRVVDVLTPVLRDLPDRLQIDGHTNQVPVQPKYFATDWELSAARAVTVLRRLNEVGRIPNERLVAAAYGHEKPLMDPAREGSQVLNKRVDIVVLADLPEETQSLLSQAADDARTTSRPMEGR